jgi:hypothetical protein
MPRTPPAFSEPLANTVLYVITGTAGETISLNFADSTITYFDITLDQSYSHILIDNVGTGAIRFSLRPGITMSSSAIGAKTLKSTDSMYIADTITHLSVYFIESSTVEFVLLA